MVELCYSAIKWLLFMLFLGFLYFPYLQMLSNIDRSKSVLDNFSHAWRKKMVRRHASHHPNPNISAWHFYLVILDCLDPKCSHRKLRMVLTGVPDAIHIDLLIYELFPLDAVKVREKTKHDKSSNVSTLTWPVTSSVIPGLMPLHFLRLILQVSRTLFEFWKSTRQLSWFGYGQKIPPPAFQPSQSCYENTPVRLGHRFMVINCRLLKGATVPCCIVGSCVQPSRL